MENQIMTFNQTTLAQLKQDAVTSYKNRTHGYDLDYTAEPNARGDYPRKMFLGAEVSTVVAYQAQLIPTYIEYASKGYTYSQTGTIPLSSAGSAQIYFYKPEAPQLEVFEDEEGNSQTRETRIEGVEYQCDDIKKLLEEVESKYRTECEAADKAATLAEESRILAEVTAQVDAEIEQERQARIELARTERGQRIQAAIKPAKKATK
jgi:hypothetical protein